MEGVPRTGGLPAPFSRVSVPRAPSHEQRRPPAPNQRSGRVCDGSRPRPPAGDKRSPSRPYRELRVLPCAQAHAGGQVRCCCSSQRWSRRPRGQPSPVSPPPQSPVRCDRASLQASPSSLSSPSLPGSRRAPRRGPAGELQRSAPVWRAHLAWPGQSGSGASPPKTHFPAG